MNKDAKVIKITDVNPYIRDAEIQNPIIEGERERYPYDYRLFYVLENEGQIIIEGQSFSLKRDSAIFIPPTLGYRFCGKLKVAILNFDMTRSADNRSVAICPQGRELFSPSLIFDGVLSEGFEAYKIIEDGIFLKEELTDIVRIWNENGLFSDAETSAKLKSMLVSVAKRGEGGADKAETLCSKIQGYIRLNAKKQIGSESIARHFGYHPVYLGEIFKERTGVSIYQAVLNERMRLAKRWLTETERTVEEIAYEIGFSSRSHFCTAFKGHVGVTPLKYRRLFQSGNGTVGTL